MNNFLAVPCRRSHFTSKEENEIREIFYQHWETMKKQMDASIEKIQEWRHQSIQEIKSYSEEQIRIVRDDYDSLRQIFDHHRDENLETAKAYHNSKEKNLFDELSIACRSLKFQVAQLDFTSDQKTRPKVRPVYDHVVRKMQDMNGAVSHAVEHHHRRSTEENVHLTENSKNDTVQPFQKSTVSIPNGAP